MIRAALLSEPGSGSTTFVGLLYLAQTRIATERADNFRFSAPPDSLRRLSVLYEQLVSGEFPRSLAPEEASQVRFEMGFSPPARWNPLHRGAGFEPRFRAECRWAHAGFDAMNRCLQTGHAEPGVIPDLRTSTAPIFVIDPLSPEPSPGTSPSDTTRDHAVATILHELLPAATPGRTAPGTRLHPAFVFTKLDSLPDGRIPAVRGGDLVDDDRLASEGARIGKALIDALLPQTAEFCRSVGTLMDAPVTFLSHAVALPGSDGGVPRLATRTLPDHRHEPVYPLGQFRALIDHLGGLARLEP